MSQGYFALASADIFWSKGWLKTVSLLGLLLFVPVFGWIAVLGFAFGWARDMAWGACAPLPTRVFENEGGGMFSRGFFILVLLVAFSAIPTAMSLFADVASLVSIGWYGDEIVPDRQSYVVGLTPRDYITPWALLSFLAAIIVIPFEWIGWMRISIYARLSAGFQINKSWAMLRYDPRGFFRVFLMVVWMLALLFVVWSVTSFVASSMTEWAFSSDLLVSSVGGDLGSAYLLFALLFAGGFFFLALSYVQLCALALIVLMGARALGHWTAQFAVPLWGGQDDPLPFQMRHAG